MQRSIVLLDSKWTPSADGFVTTLGKFCPAHKRRGQVITDSIYDQLRGSLTRGNVCPSNEEIGTYFTRSTAQHNRTKFQPTYRFVTTLGKFCPAHKRWGQLLPIRYTTSWELTRGDVCPSSEEIGTYFTRSNHQHGRTKFSTNLKTTNDSSCRRQNGTVLKYMNQTYKIWGLNSASLTKAATLLVCEDKKTAPNDKTAPILVLAQWQKCAHLYAAAYLLFLASRSRSHRAYLRSSYFKVGFGIKY
jgi:hypothetical protein